ncbi:MAG: TIGR04282 family arsenosugar biosynthesis glycosyltransferase [Aquaticitalea sp.]
MIDNKIAILIFANSAQQEALAKPFKSSDLLFDALNQETLQKVKATGLPCFQYSEKEQIGRCFAERFTNAMQSVYDKGYDTVISIGNDTPHLKSSQILKAAHQLETQDIVLGPSFDGGFYLMGLKKSIFNADTFLNLPWQTSRLSQSIFRLVAVKKIKLFTLEMLSDIDTISDVKFILQRKKQISSRLKQILSDVVSDEKTTAFFHEAFLQNSSQNQYFNKGSPRLIHA